MKSNVKTFLYSGIALVLIAAAVFFAAFGTAGKSFNYAKKASKFATVDSSVYAKVDLSAIELPKDATVEEIRAYIAKNLASKASTVITKTGDKKAASDYDLVAVNYWVTNADGEIVKFVMDPSAPAKVGLNADEELNKIFKADGDVITAALEGNYSSYKTVTAGLPDEGDKLYVTVGTETTEMTVEAFKAKFGDDAMNKRIGSELTDIADDSVKGKIAWVARTCYQSANTIESGDRAYITITTKNTSGTTLTWFARYDGTNKTVIRGNDTTVETLDDTTLNAVLPKAYALKTGVTSTYYKLTYEKADGVTEGTFGDAEYYTKSGSTYTKAEAFAEGTDYYTCTDSGLDGDYTYTVTTCVPANIGSVDSSKLDVAMSTPIEIPFAPEAEEKIGDLALAGCTVHALVVGKYTVSLTYTNISGVSAIFSGNAATKLKAVKTAYDSYEDKYDAVKDFNGVESSDVDTYLDALIAYLSDKDAEGAESTYEGAKNTFIEKATDEDKTTKLDELVKSAEALLTAIKEYGATRPYYVAAEAKAKLDEELSEKITAYEEKVAAYVAAADADKDAAKTEMDNARTALLDGLEGDAKTNAETYADKWLAYKESHTTEYTEKMTPGADVYAGFFKTNTTAMNEQAQDLIEDCAAETLLSEATTKYEEKVAEALWADVMKTPVDKLPAKAVRLAKKDIIDNYKQKYYTDEKINREFSSFKKYIASELGENWKDKVTEDAEAAVKELLIIYSLADALGIDVTVDEAQTYAADGWSSYYHTAEQCRNAYAYDKVTEKLFAENGAELSE